MYLLLLQMLEEEEVEVPVTAGKEAPKEAAKMETDEAKTDSYAAGSDVNMQDAPGTGVENGAPESEDKPVQMETDTKVCNPSYCCVAFSVIISALISHTDMTYHCLFEINDSKYFELMMLRYCMRQLSGILRC